MRQGNQWTSGRRGLPRVAAGLLAVVVGLLAAGCGRAPAERAPGALRIVVSIPPLAWVASALAPQGAEITQITPAGVGCEGVDLTPGQVVAIDRADLVMLTGLGLEAQVERAMARSERPGRRVASFTSALGITERLIDASGGGHDHDHHGHDHDHHDHDHDHDHHHHDHAHESGGKDPHVWLDPTLMALYATGAAEQMISAISAAAPDEATRAAQIEHVRARLERALAECAALDQEFDEQLATVATRAFIIEHNGYAYLARQYDLEVIASIRALHEVEPTPGDIEAAAKAARDHGVRAIFVEPQYSQAGARRVAEVTGLRLLTLDALGDGDYPAMMRRNLAALREGLNGPAAQSAADREAR